jgi:hypothetical protein
MTAKILYWNVEKFSDNKIANTADSRDPTYGRGIRQGPRRLSYMLDTFSSGIDPNGAAFIPDFIVIVEVAPGLQNNVRENVINGNAALGVMRLLRAIRGAPALNAGGQDWRVVPPIVLGGGWIAGQSPGLREGVAVYYNSARWYFLGPEDRNGGYAAPFNGVPRALRNRQIPAVYGLNPDGTNRVEDRLQGKASRYFNRPIRLRRYVDFPGPDDRRPWLTHFGSTNAANPVLLRLMSVHTSPARAADGTTRIASLLDMIGPLTAANQIDVILGDFNVDNLAAANWQAGGPFEGFVLNANPAYRPMLQPPNGLGANFNSYFMTHALQLDQAEIEGAFGHANGFYPGYGYLDQSIDNVFFRRQGVAAPVTACSTIVNRVVSMPYDQAPGPPPVPPYRGVLRYLTSFDTDLAAMILQLEQDPTYHADDAFREWENFGKVRSTSDHLPLILEV